MRRTFSFSCLLLPAGLAYAALGNAPSDFGAAQAPRLTPHRLAAASSAGAAASYTVSETKLDNGTLVREYVATNGTVFAVGWSGPFMPDLRTLLGAHFDTLVQAAAKRPKAGHSQLALRQSDVVIESGGHMRAYVGRAWIPARLPAGVAAADID